MERGHETTIEFNLPQHEQQPGTQVSRRVTRLRQFLRPF